MLTFKFILVRLATVFIKIEIQEENLKDAGKP